MRITLDEYIENMDDETTAFIGVDLQNDFGHPKGSLYVKGGEELVDIANKIVVNFCEGLVFWTKDCHPENHCSFTENGGSWPIHCVKGKWGSRFLTNLDVNKDFDIIILKGENVNVDSYSAFFDNDQNFKTELEDILLREKVSNVFIMGLATDYCVKFTVLDALSLRFDTAVYIPGCRGVEVNNGDIESAIKEMEDAGATIIGD